MGFRRFLLVALVLCLIPSEVVVARDVVLKPGQAHFWVGPFIENPTNETWDYSFEIPRSAYRLRVGIDHPDVEDGFILTLRRPDGSTRSIFANGGLYSQEYLEREPEPGTYEIKVRSESAASKTNFRVRVKLEAAAPSLGTKKGPVLPNLQVLPPHEASFLMPTSNGSTGGNPEGIDLLGAESCHPEEHVEDGAVRCLRFAYGVRNTGLGPMDLFYEGAGVGADKPLYQRIHHADGSVHEWEAGTAKYHKTHGHYHHDAAIGLQLFKVADRKRGKLEVAGEPRTKGFAHREELLREWDTFYPTWQLFGFGLGSGWADIYEWDRPGNYIDFGTNGDGYYVIRMEADPVKGVVESNERDNHAYTYLKVTGSEVKLIEAGRGKDPWDRCKIVVGFGGHPDPRQPKRPASCPPDTV